MKKIQKKMGRPKIAPEEKPVSRISVDLREISYKKLCEIAKKERRTIRAQARMILEEALDGID